MGKDITPQQVLKRHGTVVRSTVLPRASPGPWGLLLVDDEPDVIATLKELVQDFFEGVTVLTASSGREGLAILARNRIHVVVSDFRMPGMDGLKFLAQVKTLHPGVRRMLFTAYVNAELANRAVSDDTVEEFLSKKLDPSDFLWAIAELMQKADSCSSAPLSAADQGMDGTIQDPVHRTPHDRPLERDVTQRRAEEAQLRRLASVVRDSNDAITVQDLEGRFEAWNKGAERMYGYTETEALGMNNSQLVPESGRERALEMVRQMRNNGRPVDSVELQRVTKDGRILDVWLTITKLLDDQQNIVGIATTERDITERRVREQERLEAQARIHEVARLQEINRFTTRFINMAAHELWTPLMPLRTQVHLLLNGKANPPAASQVQALVLIERNIERLGTLVDDLLTVSRSHAGRLGIDPQSVDLGKLVTEASDGYQAVAKSRGIELTVHQADPPAIAADPKRVPQVLANLLSNALKFTPRGGHVRVEVADESTLVRVSVIDDGMGIDEADLPRLFHPFVQVHDTAQVTAPGSGLGLYICKQFVEMHGGAVGAASGGKNEGATFWFTLPKAGAPPRQPAPGPGPVLDLILNPAAQGDAPVLEEAFT